MDAITIQKLNQYGISLIKKDDGRKQLFGTSKMAGFIAAWCYTASDDDIENFIQELDLCITGQYDYYTNDVTEYSIDDYDIEFSPAGIKFYTIDSQNIIRHTEIVPYIDVKILLQAWQSF